MGFTVHHEPFVSRTFERTDGVSDFIVKNLPPPARHRIEAGSLQAYENIRNADPRHAGNIQDLRWREAMAVDLKSLLDSGKEALIIVDLQVRMNTALHENSRPAQHQRFFDFFIDHVIRQNIRLWIALDSIERAERAELFAHIRVVNIAIDDIADDIVRVNALPDSICAVREIEESRFFKKAHSLFWTDSATFSSRFQNRFDTSHMNCRL